MKVFKPKKVEIVRIQFGNSKSISFEDTTIHEVFDVMVNVFSELKLNTTLELKNHSVFTKPSTLIVSRVNVRYEGFNYKKTNHKGASKNKTLYGINQEDAYNYFKDNYEKFL